MKQGNSITIILKKKS